ncbi:telomerase reverse transcriptase [Cucumis melo var. makuwa]|uniref:Telomerase reverse transcriptase n=2 Tax=Cucumis melo TaxID=3656 RepID=A0A5A7TXI3_CUCMM|nr:telomerase reverse transcriptase [Cucumis melo]KAA0048343.1 telomerase reverse transcriptase [Cucumis melo var. makuwa]
MVKKPRVPEVLWRLFSRRARTLADTITSLLPPPDCLCHKRRCLRCSGATPEGFLLRPDDPCHYRQLLTQCYVVISEKASPVYDFSNESRWSQRQIVVRCIQMIISTQPVDSNLICCGFNTLAQSSPIVDLLTCPAWDLLLSRVRDDMMIYLLMNSSIFLLTSQKRHHQVAGLPINNLCNKLSEYSTGSSNQRNLSELQKKRKRDGHQPSGSFNDPLPPVHARYFSGCESSYVQSSCWHQEDKQSHLSNVISQSISMPNRTHENNSNEQSEKSSQSVTELGKRRRPFRWQRKRQRRLLDPGNNCNSIPCTSTYSGKNTLHAKPPHQLSYQSCHSHMQSRKITKEVYINRKSMFYNLDSSTNLLKGNILGSLRPNFAGSESLAGYIFGSYIANGNTPSSLLFCNSGTCPFGSKCVYRSLTKLLKVLIRRSRNCQYVRLLDKHCGAPSLEQISTGNSGSMVECHRSESNTEIGEDTGGSDAIRSEDYLEAIDPQFAAKIYCPKNQVVSFIWAVCRSIVPPDMLGTCSNWRILRRNIFKFIKLRRFESFSLKQAMHQLKTSRFSFLSDKSSCCQNGRVLNSAEKRKFIESWIYWLFSHLIVPLIQAHFYVTETEFGRQDVYFFRKSIWEKLTKGATTSFKNKGYCYLNDSTVRDILKNRSFGFSKLRLCPKENGVRILANLKAYSKMPTENGGSCGGFGEKKPVEFKYYKSVNNVLRDTHAVLKGIKLKEPELLGSSVFDYNDVYQKLRLFLPGVKKAKASMPDLFLVVSDVSNAFDSVDQDKLLDVMKTIIVKDEYHLKQYHQILCTKKTMWAHENVMLIDPNISPRFSSSQFRSLHSVLVNQERSSFVNKNDFIRILHEHVKRNVMQFDKKFYIQRTGISQGSVLSSFLCSLYFGDLERKVLFPFLGKVIASRANEVSLGQNRFDPSISPSSNVDEMITNPGYMLLRFIDDFLFISSSKLLAEKFLCRVHRGFRAYNCYMNERKFGMNFDVANTYRIVSKRVYVGKDGVSFLRWAGLLINCQTLEIQADYTKYLNNHLSSSLTVSWQGKPGHNLKEKLCDYLRPKCHPIFYDTNINTAAVVRLNIFQAFLICAMKFHCYICQLSYICKFSRNFLLKIILRSLRYMDVLIKNKMSSIQLDSLPRPSLQLEDEEVEWLGLNAYVQVLTRKQARHTRLLSLLKSRLLAHRLSDCISSDCIYAVDVSRSSLLWEIKY